MFTRLNSSLLSYLTTQGKAGSTTTGGSTTTTTATAGDAVVARAAAKAGPQAALQRAAGTAKAAGAVQSLQANQKALGSDLRAAMAKAGVKLEGAIEFTVKADGSVGLKGSDADKAATQAFLKADASQPSFASRIATQARDAMKLSTEIQQSAAISQAAKMAKTSGGVIALYQTLMQQSAATSVVFSVSAGSSSLTYPGSLTANA
ncbi:hypothetical protein ACG02S_16575 [Roseateles sp. DC23W]|uniref:Uncharacterized protein n=1 Tax=Pelomonas dachongensis TaxID=3299029 RepID=A0ABW7EPS6_9BURK